MRKRLAFICTGLVVVWMLVSLVRKRLDAPKWDVIVTDSRGVPVGGVPVTETWQNYSCEREEHTTTLITDDRGAVHFPARYARHSPIECGRETLLEAAALAHGSFGPHARVDVSGLICVVDEKGDCIDWTGAPRSTVTHVFLKQP